LLFIALDRAGTRSGAWPLIPGQAVALLSVLPFASPSSVLMARLVLVEKTTARQSLGLAVAATAVVLVTIG
jgi:hypothetical protein